MLRRVTPFLLPPPPLCYLFYRTLGRSLGRDSRRRQFGLYWPLLFGYTFKSVNLHPRDGARPRVDVRDSRISPLSQEVPVRPPGLFGSFFGYLLFFLIVLAFPYFSVTPVRCVFFSLSLSALLDLDPACAGHTKVCIGLRMQEVDLGLWELCSVCLVPSFGVLRSVTGYLRCSYVTFLGWCTVEVCLVLWDVGFTYSLELPWVLNMLINTVTPFILRWGILV